MRIKALLISRDVRSVSLVQGLALAALLSGVRPVVASSLDKADWYADVPPRETVVEFETKFGVFRLPIGYYTYPGTLPRFELPRDGFGRFRYKLGALQFHFTMPDGHQNAAVQWFRPGDDGGDRIGIDPRRYSIWITRMDQPGPRDRLEEIDVLSSDAPPDRLVPIELANDPLESYYKGWTHNLIDHQPIGLTISCSVDAPDKGSAGICQGHIFVKTMNLDLEFLMKVRHYQDVFAVAQMTSRLLVKWQY